MTTAVPDILARIVEHKKAELQNAPVPVGNWKKPRAARLAERRNFADSLRARNRRPLSRKSKRHLRAKDF